MRVQALPATTTLRALEHYVKLHKSLTKEELLLLHQAIQDKDQQQLNALLEKQTKREIYALFPILGDAASKQLQAYLDNKEGL